MSIDVNVCKKLMNKGFSPDAINAAFEAAQKGQSAEILKDSVTGF